MRLHRAGRKPGSWPRAGCSGFPPESLALPRTGLASIHAQVRANVAGIAELLGKDLEMVRRGTAIEIDDAFFGEGYGIPTSGSREAIQLAARTEALFLDPTYTGKAMAGLISYVRQQRFTEKQTVLFWHTGGQVGLFA